MCSDIARLGHEIRLLTTVDDILPTNGTFALSLRTGTQTRVVSASHLVLATGRSGAPLLSRLANYGTPLCYLGRYDVGVRLEFPYDCWPTIDRYHNDLKLEFGHARTFCVCVNGTVAPYRVGNAFLLEGYSDPATSTGLTNLGIALRVSDNDPLFFNKIVDRVGTISGGRPVRESLVTYLGEGGASGHDIRSSITFWHPGPVSACYPAHVSSRIRDSVRRFASAFLPQHEWRRVAVFGPEVDYYWPTVVVKPDFRTAIDKLFVIGDATTRFRGILQAFASGLHTARVLANDIRRAA